MCFHIKMVWIGCIIPLCHHSIPFSPATNTMSDHIVCANGVGFNSCTRFVSVWYWRPTRTTYRQRARLQRIYELLLFCTGMAYLLCALDTDEIHAIILLLERFADRQTIDNWSERERESCTRLKAFRFEQLMPTGMSKVFKTHRRSNILWSPNGPARRPFHTHRMRKPTRTH